MRFICSSVPLTAVCVLLYVQAGDGRGANWFNEYTFAVWEDDLLVPIAKTGAGVTDEEIAEIDRFVRENTREKFGPVRSVTPELVFELAFDARINGGAPAGGRRGCWLECRLVREDRDPCSSAHTDLG